jgi:hypothetical protein
MKWVRVKPDGVVDLDSGKSQRDDCIQAPDEVQLDWKFENGVWSDPKADYKVQISYYESFLSAGYVDEITGIKLRTDIQAWHRFDLGASDITRMKVWELPLPETVWFYDYTNIERELPPQQFIELMYRYAQHCKNFYRAYAP